MSSYAPLLGHEDAWQWRPNLIWFDNLSAYATPNYYVQQTVQPSTAATSCCRRRSPTPTARPPTTPRLYATTSRYDDGDMTIMVVNPGDDAIEADSRAGESERRRVPPRPRCSPVRRRTRTRSSAGQSEADDAGPGGRGERIFPRLPGASH